jgi:hypothetical protein
VVLPSCLLVCGSSSQATRSVQLVSFGEIFPPSLHHSRLGGITVHLTRGSTLLREITRRASEKSCLVYHKLSPRLYRARGDLAYVQLLIIAALPCSILLLRCILALIRDPFHPELGHRRCLQGRTCSYGRKCNWHFPHGLDGRDVLVFVSFSFICARSSSASKCHHWAALSH